MYVHPSEAEGLAITILEAMSYGKTVLISDIPENLEAMGEYGKQYVKNNFLITRHLLDYIQLFKKFK